MSGPIRRMFTIQIDPQRSLDVAFDDDTMHVDVWSENSYHSAELTPLMAVNLADEIGRWILEREES